MPLYEYVCKNGHHTDRFVRVDDRNQPQPCDCGKTARRVYSADVGFRVGKEGLLNTRTLPNDGVHGLAKSKNRTTHPTR